MELCIGDTDFVLKEETGEDFNDDVDGLSGIKVWECSKDLVTYLQNTDTVLKCGGGRRTVLELGSGHGLPGLFCLKHFVEVTFHDYSASVLKLTEANVNACQHRWNVNLGASKFVAGPWENLELGALTFDLILSSEGIYKEDSFSPLIRLLERYLAPNGVALFAAKRYYFGCGGGTQPFLQSLPPTLVGQVAHIVEDKKSNIREIIAIRRTTGDGS